MAQVLEFEIGPAIRTADGLKGSLRHIPFSIPIHLNMDSAGGHGSVAVIAQYVDMMKVKFNIIITFQPTNSPECNALDVGFWCAIQSVVSKLCRKTRMNPMSLVAKVNEAWNSFKSLEGQQKLTNIVDYLRIEAINTILDNGGNDKAESVRGKKQYAPNYVPNVMYVADRAVFLQQQRQKEGGSAAVDESEHADSSEDEAEVMDEDNVYINNE